jgi:hypothetical protein
MAVAVTQMQQGAAAAWSPVRMRGEQGNEGCHAGFDRGETRRGKKFDGEGVGGILRWRWGETGAGAK